MRATLQRKPNGDGTIRWYLDLSKDMPGSKWILCESITTDDRAAAKRWRDMYIATMKRMGATQVRVSPAHETVGEWFSRYYDAAALGTVGRKNRGAPQVTAERRRAAFNTHLRPILGHLPMTDVGIPEDAIRAVVRYLNEQVRIRMSFYRGEIGVDDRTGKKPGMSPKTAKHVFGELTNGFKEACGSLDDSLKVLSRDANPMRGIFPPMSGDDRIQVALYPSEVIGLLSCEDIPATRRITYAVAIYSGMRRSELERLESTDVDLEHRQIRVRGKKSPAAKRRVPIEPALLPLVTALTKAYPSGPLLDVPNADGKGGASDLMKKDLRRAKIDRAELFADTAVEMPFTFHGARHTAITHSYVLGRDETFLKNVYGHTTNAMTRRYLDAAVIGRATFGAPFPKLPAGLIKIIPTSPVTVPVTVVTGSTKAKRGTLGIPRSSHIAFGDPSGNRTDDFSPEKQASNEATASFSSPVVTENNGGQHEQSADVEVALARALDAAVTAGRFETVDAIVRALEARRRR